MCCLLILLFVFLFRVGFVFFRRGALPSTFPLFSCCGEFPLLFFSVVCSCVRFHTGGNDRVFSSWSRRNSFRSAVLRFTLVAEDMPVGVVGMCHDALLLGVR